jgi:hypothetical protein
MQYSCKQCGGPLPPDMTQGCRVCPSDPDAAYLDLFHSDFEAWLDKYIRKMYASHQAERERWTKRWFSDCLAGRWVPLPPPSPFFTPAEPAASARMPPTADA